MTAPPLCVCIPARNEAEVLPALLHALIGQDLPGPLRVLVAANNCTDDTVALARGAAGRLSLRVLEAVLPAERANAGVARGLAMDGGAAWLLEEGVAGGILLTTDADAVPPPHWVSANIRALAAGAEAVGGEIRLLEDLSRPLPPWLTATRARVARYWSAVRALAHRLDPVPYDVPPRHGDHTGASLAVTLAAYRAAGGVPPIPTGEDNALVAAIERNGGRLRHAPDAWVRVSAREEGRAAGGMAEEMRRWRRIAEGAEPHLLPDAAHWDTAFRRRRALRDGFGRDLARTALATGADPARFAAIASESVNAIAFVARAEPVLPPLTARMEPIEAATEALERLAGRAEAA